MSDEETTTGVQLAKSVFNKNPLVSEEVPTSGEVQEIEGLGDDQCKNTIRAAMFLSVYLATIRTVSIAKKTVPQDERGQGMTFNNLGILRLKRREKVQGALGGEERRGAKR